MGSPFNIPVPPLNDVVTHGAVTDAQTGFYLPDNSTAVITVSGNITLALNSGYSFSGDAAHGSDITAVGLVAPPTGLVRNGAAPSELVVKYHLSGQSFTPSLTPDPTDSTQYSFTYRVTQGGEILVGRSGLRGEQTCGANPNPSIPSACITPDGDVPEYDVPSYKMSGTQTISVERLDDDVTLTAVTSTGAKGRSVTFTAIPLASGGGVWGWVWTPDSTPGQTVACSTAVNPCVTNVYESGTMDVTYYVPSIGLARHAKAHVSAVDCATGDSVIDNPIFRFGLNSIWDSTHTDDTHLESHIEHGLYEIDSAGTHNLKILFGPHDAMDTPCRNLNSVAAQPTDVLLFSAHTHGFALGDSVPPTCSDSALGPNQYRIYGIGDGGLSPDDQIRQYTDRTEYGVKAMYVIDKDSIYRGAGPSGLDTLKDGAGTPILDSHGQLQLKPTSDWRDSTHAFPRRQTSPSCSIY